MAYRSAQRRVVGGAAVPYGYTVVTWTRLDRPARSGVSSAVAAAAGLGLSAGAAQFVDGAPAFAIVAFLATAAYFLVGAIGVSLLDRRPPTADIGHLEDRPTTRRRAHADSH